MTSAKNKFEIARNRSCTSIKENLMCSSIILKNSSGLLKNSSIVDGERDNYGRPVDYLNYDNTSKNEILHCNNPLDESVGRKVNAKNLHKYLYMNEEEDNNEEFPFNTDISYDRELSNEFSRGMLYDKIGMSNRTYNTVVDNVHNNFQTNKLENVVNSIKFQDNTNIKIPSYLRCSPLYVLYPELSYLQTGGDPSGSQKCTIKDAQAGPRNDAQAGPRNDAQVGPKNDAQVGPRNDAQVGPRNDSEGGVQDLGGGTPGVGRRVSSELSRNKNLQDYLRYTINNNHTIGRNKMYEYFESSKKNMVEIGSPNDLNHTILYRKTKSPTDVILNLYKNRHVSSSSNHMENELKTLNVLKMQKMPIVEKKEKGEINIITSEVNPKKKVNLLNNCTNSDDMNNPQKAHMSNRKNSNFIINLIDMSSSENISLKTVDLNSDKNGTRVKNIFQMQKKNKKDVQVQTNDEDFKEAAKCAVDLDIERVVNIFSEKKKKKNTCPPEDALKSDHSEKSSSSVKGKKRIFKISYNDSMVGDSNQICAEEIDEEAHSRTDESYSSESVRGGADSEADSEADAGAGADSEADSRADAGAGADSEADSRAEAGAGAENDGTKKNNQFRMTQLMANHNQCVKSRRPVERLRGTRLKNHLNAYRQSYPFRSKISHLKGSRISGNGTDIQKGKDHNGQDNEENQMERDHVMNLLTSGYLPMAHDGSHIPHLGRSMKKAIFIPNRGYNAPVHRYNMVSKHRHDIALEHKYDMERSYRNTIEPSIVYRNIEEISPMSEIYKHDKPISKEVDKYYKELQKILPRESSVCMNIENSAPRGLTNKNDRLGEFHIGEVETGTRKSLAECISEPNKKSYEKDKITNELLLKKLYIEKKKNLYEKKKLEKSLASIVEKRTMLRERARDKFNNLWSNYYDKSSSSADWDHISFLKRTGRCTRKISKRLEKHDSVDRVNNRTNLDSYKKGNISSCSNVNLYSSNEVSINEFNKNINNAPRNYSVQNGKKYKGVNITNERHISNIIFGIKNHHPTVRKVRKKKECKTMENEKRIEEPISSFMLKSFRDIRYRDALNDERLRSRSYKNRVKKLNLLKRSIQSFKTHTQRNIQQKGDGEYKQNDIVQEEVRRCIERGGYFEPNNMVQILEDYESDDAGALDKHFIKHHEGGMKNNNIKEENIYIENQNCEEILNGALKITYNIGKSTEMGNSIAEEQNHSENAFSTLQNEKRKNQNNQRNYDTNCGNRYDTNCNVKEDRAQENICERTSAQIDVMEKEINSFLKIEGEEKGENVILEESTEMRNVLNTYNCMNNDTINKNLNKSDDLIRIKVNIKNSNNGDKSDGDKFNSIIRENSATDGYDSHENSEKFSQHSYKDTDNVFINRLGLTALEKGNFSDTELANRRKNPEILSIKGDYSNGNNNSKCDTYAGKNFLRKNDGSGGGDYLKIKQNGFMNKMKSYSHSKVVNQIWKRRDRLHRISSNYNHNCSSSLCKTNSKTEESVNLERIDPNRWIQKIFGDTN
ncbi:hypothetical protein, conserved [Plasmodium gonderi]|uniref:Uncharacterized protein n=1 Tax=Plasmodium gonderi TaxID=77519 RepID=A0A1Y1JID3_PLAGO|nr:hypothetical protein, conserved [Plasmodium gonderi]GAW80947.1 hypothetical protein, conserved [Plasmodium gonderi]